MAFILRHEPGSIGITLDDDGWVDVVGLVTNANASGKSITREQVNEVVACSEEKRFELSDDGLRIRSAVEG